MIKAFTFVLTDHQKLHNWVMEFFNKIETDDGVFRDDLFNPDFLKIVNGHPRILKSKLKEIFEYTKKLTKTDRYAFIHDILGSNKIEEICSGKYKPKRVDGSAAGIEKVLKELFTKLYTQVLDGEHFNNKIGKTLRDHFNEFSDINENITICPVCGIGELKKSADKIRDQYDHYLPISLYPFSSVNFYNLVPYCTDCNSLQVKGNKDIIEIANGPFFYLYETDFSGLSFIQHISAVSAKLNEIEWTFEFVAKKGRLNEIAAWRSIYNIDSRYNGYIKGRIKKWYKSYFQFINNKKNPVKTKDERKSNYFEVLNSRVESGLSFIEKPVLETLLTESIELAEQEAKKYSLQVQC